MDNFTLIDKWTPLDWVVLVVYFAVLIGIGIIFKKRASKDMKSFFVAGRKLTIPILLGAAAASWYDSWTVVGLAECGWTMGISIIFVYVIPTAILRLPLALVIGPMVRSDIPDWVVTLPDLLEFLYDRKTKIAAGFAILPLVLYESALLFAIGQVLHMITGMNMLLAMAICGGILAFYTSMSGMWGVAVTDIFQFAIMTFSAGMLIYPIATQNGGIPQLMLDIAQRDPNLVTASGGMGTIAILGWLVSAFAMYANAQCYQRFGAAKNSGDIKIAYTLMMFLGISYSTVMVISGMAASVQFGHLSPAEGFWALVFEFLPIGMQGLFVAALAAAVMSTASADFLIYSTVISNDIWRTLVNPNMTEQQLVKSTKYMIPVLAALTVIGTYFWADGIAKAYYYIGGFQVAVFFVPIVAGLFYRKKTAAAGFVTIVCAIIVYPIWQFALGVPFDIPANLATWIVSGIIFFIASKLTYGRSEVNKLVD